MTNVFCPLASGSKGNALYLASAKTRILIDVGLSYKQLIERLGTIGVSIDAIDAVLITHEHADHIKGLEILCKRRDIPIFANADTAKAICSLMSITPKFKIFSTGENFSFGDLECHPFSVQHDTLDPVAYTIKIGTKKVGVCSDLGFVTTLVKNHLRDCDVLYLESNHEPSMVHACSRPMTYKQRVLGRQGHLSNQSCAELLEELYHVHLKKVYLAHLSEECNHPEVALKTSKMSFEKVGREVDICIAYQHQVSEKIFF